MKILLSSGGPDIFKVIALFAKTTTIQKKKIGYCIIAAENTPSLFEKILKNNRALEECFKSYGADAYTCITSENIMECLDQDILILSGGDTQYLLEVCRKHDMAYHLSHSSVENILGISAGAIALAKNGIGTHEGKEVFYEGMGLVDVCIVPHSNTEKKRTYPDAMHLEEYEYIDNVI